MTPDTMLRQARELVERRVWGAAFETLQAADATTPLEAADLEAMAVAAYMSGHDEQSDASWARAHRGWLRQHELDAAVRCAAWLGISLLIRGQIAPARGWFARARNVLGDQPDRSTGAGYCAGVSGLEALFGGDPVSAHECFAAVLECGSADADVLTLGRLGCGQSLVAMRRVSEGVAMLDEAMVAVTAGEVSPLVTGLVYCAMIDACQELCDVRRAREWTAALGDWCDAQPDLVPYRGQCLVHRAELMRIDSSWTAALAEAERAAEVLAAVHHPATGAAFYVQAELHRLRGEIHSAEECYRLASEWGHGGQPGLALLRVAQGRIDTAGTGIRSALAENPWPATKARLLAAHVDTMLADGDVASARTSADELAVLTSELGNPPMLDAMSGDATGDVLLAEGDPNAALRELRKAWTCWQQLGAAYDAARTRVRIGLACRRLGDDDTAAMELAISRRVFVEMGAAPDVSMVDALSASPAAPGGLTGREIEVLGLVAGGRTNAAIAAALTISEKTVARHVSNIFAKLGLTSRAAATAYAYEHGLVHRTTHAVGGGKMGN